MAKSPAEMKASMIASLKASTGKPTAEWLDLVRSSGLSKHKDIVVSLKSEHQLTHWFASMIALQTLHSDSHPESNPNASVDAQNSETKSSLRPIYEALLTAVMKFGMDVEVSPKKGSVSLRRRKQFAIVQPSTATRVDVGINFQDNGTTQRLEASGSFNTMLNHRVRVVAPDELDGKLIACLKRAYDEA